MLAVQARQGHSFRFWRAADSYQPVVARARQALNDAGLAAMADEPVARLSHGEMRQLEMAMTLSGEPRLLLLDEPMAGMSPSDSHKVIAVLRGLKGRYTTVLVEHDMDAVFALADRISVLFYGQILVTGTVEEIRSNPVAFTITLAAPGARSWPARYPRLTVTLSSPLSVPFPNQPVKELLVAPPPGFTGFLLSSPQPTMRVRLSAAAKLSSEGSGRRSRARSPGICALRLVENPAKTTVSTDFMPDRPSRQWSQARGKSGLGGEAANVG